MKLIFTGTAMVSVAAALILVLFALILQKKKKKNYKNFKLLTIIKYILLRVGIFRHDKTQKIGLISTLQLT